MQVDRREGVQSGAVHHAAAARGDVAVEKEVAVPSSASVAVLAEVPAK